MADYTTSKTLNPSNSVNGTRYTTNDFGLNDISVFTYLRISDLTAGTLQIRFGEEDDWATLSLPFTLYSIRFMEFWLKSSESDTDVTVIVSMIAR